MGTEAPLFLVAQLLYNLIYTIVCAAVCIFVVAFEDIWLNKFRQATL